MSQTTEENKAEERTIGYLLKFYRVRAGLQQKEFALLIDTKPTYLSALERDVRRSWKINARIGKYLELSCVEKAELFDKGDE